MLKFGLRIILCSWLSAGLALGQAEVVSANSADAPSAGFAAAHSGSILTRKDARAITLMIPAPRGMIIDRHGEVFAQNRVVYRVALQFRQFESVDRDFIVAWGRERIRGLEALVPNVMSKTDDDLYQHYRHRRWLPLYLTTDMSDEEAVLLKDRLPSDVVLTPVYSRFYPNGSMAAHIIGYSGSVGKLPTGPINFKDPLWEDMEGRAGLEKLYNERLAGQPGLKRLIFDEHGNKLLEEQVKRPVPGGTLVTTLDLKWQKVAEETLEKGCERGAFVVVDVITGEVLVMASRPTFDLNVFTPRISEEVFRALNDDPGKPLYGRAFQSAYPPASTFKPVVALEALNLGAVTAESLIDCPVSIQVGNVVFNNWNKHPEGEINVMRAIARSCNTWFYQVGMQIGGPAFIKLAGQLGYGSRTDLPLIGETPGILPNNEWMIQHEGRRILDGDACNLSIGQGSLLASPLQVAQAMAGIANGRVLPQLQLIHQIQDMHGRLIEAPSPKPRNRLNLSPYSVFVTHLGMSDVVNGAGGTGRGGQLSYAKLCGKTGTAQWGPEEKNQRLAWFAGFMPEENPRYAFAVLYEGKPNERVSGGRLAAPMVKKFFEEVKEDILATIAPPQRATVVITEGAGASIPTAVPVSGDDVRPLSLPELDEGLFPRIDGQPLRAIPIEPLDPEIQQIPIDENEPRRAIPVLEARDPAPPAATPVLEPEFDGSGE